MSHAKERPHLLTQALSPESIRWPEESAGVKGESQDDACEVSQGEQGCQRGWEETAQVSGDPGRPSGVQRPLLLSVVRLHGDFCARWRTIKRDEGEIQWLQNTFSLTAKETEAGEEQRPGQGKKAQAPVKRWECQERISLLPVSFSSTYMYHTKAQGTQGGFTVPIQSPCHSDRLTRSPPPISRHGHHWTVLTTVPRSLVSKLACASILQGYVTRKRDRQGRRPLPVPHMVTGHLPALPNNGNTRGGSAHWAPAWMADSS